MLKVVCCYIIEGTTSRNSYLVDIRQTVIRSSICGKIYRKPAAIGREICWKTSGLGNGEYCTPPLKLQLR